MTHPAPENAATRFRIEDLVLDAGARRVMRGDEKLKLGGLTFDLLLALAKSSPSLLTYDELAKQVWRGRPVTPETIAQRAKMLRDSLSDDAKSPRYFELIRGQGYRLLVIVEAMPEPSPPLRVNRSLAIAVVAIVASGLLLVVGLMLQQPVAPTSVAVLPFVDLSEHGDQQYFADGVAEELINELTGLAGLDVASRTESFFYRGPTSDLQQTGKALGVSAILEGSVRKSEDKIRITVQLVDVSNGYHLWSDSFDRNPQDIFAIQEDIASSVAGALGVKLGVGGVNEYQGAGTRNFDAYEAYLREDFTKAIEIDPNYAVAWASRGLEIAASMYDHPPEQAPAIIERAYQHISKAIELDPRSAGVHSDFATMIYATMDWERAERSFAESMSLRRNTYNIGHYANMQMRSGRSRAAIALYDEYASLLRVPEEPWLHEVEARVALRQFDVARQLAAQIQDEWWRNIALLTVVLNDGSAVDVRAAINAMSPESIAYRELYGPLLPLLGSPDEALAFLGDLAADADRMWPDKYQAIAVLAAYLGAPEFAFEVFSRELPYTAIRFGALWYPVMADVRRLPEFKKFVIEAKLVDYWRKYGWTDFCRPLGREDFTCE